MMPLNTGKAQNKLDNAKRQRDNVRNNQEKKMQVMNFHSTRRATAMCVCRVENGVGIDAFGEEWRVVVDDFGAIVFVRG